MADNAIRITGKSGIRTFLWIGYVTSPKLLRWYSIRFIRSNLSFCGTPLRYFRCPLNAR